MFRKLPVRITDRLQNARLNLPLFLSSRRFYSCSLLFPLIWSRCCSCWKMERCVFCEGEARQCLPGEPAGSQAAAGGSGSCAAPGALLARAPEAIRTSGKVPRVFSLSLLCSQNWGEEKVVKAKKCTYSLKAPSLVRLI